MTYTTQQLQAMSDDEVNASLATKQYKKEFTAKEIRNLIGIAAVPCDYCNNPNDIMPLAFERKIGIDFIGGFGWTAEYFYSDISFSCYSNPLRAIACLLLMMED